jgi:hypothetical protein
MGPWGSSTDLAEAVTPKWRPVGWVERLPPPFSTAWPSSSHVDMCPRSHKLNQLKTWPAG